MNADVALDDDHDATPAAGVLEAVGFGPVHGRLGQFVHAKSFRQFTEALLNQLPIQQLFARTTVGVDHEVLAEMLAAGWRIKRTEFPGYAHSRHARHFHYFSPVPLVRQTLCCRN